jgi:hypothetical protein
MENEGQQGPWIFVDLGSTASEDGVFSLVDTAGKLHVLYRQDKEDYTCVAVSALGDVEARDRYRPKKGMKPSLATKVYVQYAEKVER